MEGREALRRAAVMLGKVEDGDPWHWYASSLSRLILADLSRGEAAQRVPDDDPYYEEAQALGLVVDRFHAGD